MQKPTPSEGIGLALFFFKKKLLINDTRSAL